MKEQVKEYLKQYAAKNVSNIRFRKRLMSRLAKHRAKHNEWVEKNRMRMRELNRKCYQRKKTERALMARMKYAALKSIREGLMTRSPCACGEEEVWLRFEGEKHLWICRPCFWKRVIDQRENKNHKNL